MSPVTWQSNTPMPDSVPESTEKTPTFEMAELAVTALTHVSGSGDGFGEGDGERTQVVSSAFELRPRFTGRSRGISELSTLAEKAFNDRESAYAVIVGEPGMGKSRIISELVARLRSQFPTLAAVKGIADENSHAYGPIARALTARFGLVPGEDPTESRDKIQAGVAEVVKPQQVTEVAHLIAHLLRVPFEDSPVVTPLIEQPQRLEARLFMALKRMVQAESERHPVLIVVENLELCGADTINFMHYLAAGLRESRVLLVGTCTKEAYERHPSLGAGENAPKKIELGALSPSEAEDLLRELCKPLDEIPPAVLVRAKALGGSPRAIHELVRLLLESDVIVREGTRWSIDKQRLAQMALPATYDDVVAARLRVMEATERRALEMAAVVGETSWLDGILALERSFSTAAVGADPDGPTLQQIAASGDHSRITLVAAIAKLVEHEWLADVPQSSISGERELRFANPNLWNLVYKTIDENRRRQYHGVVARWLELHPDGRGPAAQEEVARHLALAGEAREAAQRYRRAAEQARAAFANESAIRLFDMALACIGSSATNDMATRIHIWHDLGSVYELIGDFEAALGAFERMLRLSWVAASKTKAAVAFNKMGRVWRRKGDLKLTLEYLERGLELFRGANDGRGIAGSLDDIGKSLHMLGRYDEAHAKITEALARRSKSNDKRAIATSLSRLGEVQQDRGQYESARKCHEEAHELRKVTGDRWGQIVSGNNLAALAFEVGDRAAARHGWTVALAEAEDIGALPLSALVLTNLGELSVVENKLDEARSRLENALEIIEDIEDRGLETECCRHLAQLEKAQGHTQEARELAERALAVAKKAGLREKEAQAYLTLGDVLAAKLYDAGDEHHGMAPAEIAFTKAVEIMQSIRNEAALAHAQVAFGRYKAEAGQVGDGKKMIKAAVATFTKLGLSKPVEDANALLQSLT